MFFLIRRHSTVAAAVIGHLDPASNAAQDPSTPQQSDASTAGGRPPCLHSALLTTRSVPRAPRRQASPRPLTVSQTRQRPATEIQWTAARGIVLALPSPAPPAQVNAAPPVLTPIPSPSSPVSTRQLPPPHQGIAPFGGAAPNRHSAARATPATSPPQPYRAKATLRLPSPTRTAAASAPAD